MADREKKVGAMETQKFEYLENEKSYLDEIKIMFHNYSRAISWWKKKRKIADTGFTVTNQTFNKKYGVQE